MQTSKQIHFKPNDLVKVKQVKNNVEILNTSKCNHCPVIKRLCKGVHVNTKTGEIIYDKVQKTRADTYSLQIANRNLADLIKNNLSDYKKMLLLTLTYSPKQSNYKKIAEDFKRFIKKLRQQVTQFGTIDYIYVLELYDDLVNFHIHAILFFNSATQNVFIDKDLIYKLWGHGDISVSQPTKDNQIISYLTAHKVKNVTEQNKHLHEKALRQEHLPTGIKYYRYSTGIRKPIIYTETYANALKTLVSSGFKYYNTVSFISPVKDANGKQIYYHKLFYKK